MGLPGRPGPKRKSLTESIEHGLKADRTGSNRQKDLERLTKLTYPNVVHKKYAFQVYKAMCLLWQHLVDLTPLKQTVLFLAVYCIARQCSTGTELRTPVRFEGGTLTLEDYLSLVSAVNPLSGYSMQHIIPNLNLHPVYKDQGEDGFFNKGQAWWNMWSSRVGAHPHLKAGILLSALFFLCVRGERPLQWLLDNPDKLFDRFDYWTDFYRAACLDDTPYFGLKADNKKKQKRGQHTTEQITRSAGQALDNLLQPLWKNSKPLHDLIQASTPAQYADALAQICYFGGDLTFSHSLEYLQLWDSSSLSPIFTCRMSKQQLATFIKAGKNSQAFLRIANAAGQRSKPTSVTYEQFSNKVFDCLPDRIHFSDDATPASFPHFYATDGSQNACKAMEVYQTLLTGVWGGKHRGDASPTPVAVVKKSMLKKKSVRKIK